MFDQIETFILSTAHSLYDAWGWIGVSALLVFENATGITPSEIILGLAGWMLIADYQVHPSMIFLGGLYAAIGSVIGASISYWTARLGGRPLVNKLAEWLKIKQDHLDRAEAQFQRWGPGVVLVGRVMPGIRTLVNIPAGLAHMNFPTFFGITLIGSYIWCTLLIAAGYWLGHEWELISTYLKQLMPYLLGFGVAALAFYIWFSRRKTTTDSEQSEEA